MFSNEGHACFHPPCFSASREDSVKKTARKNINLLFPLNRISSIMKCYSILFISGFAKKVSLWKLSNQANSRWNNNFEGFFSFFFRDTALKNWCYFTLVMVWSRELTILRKTRQLSQTKQWYAVTFAVHMHAGLILGEILCIWKSCCIEKLFLWHN